MGSHPKIMHRSPSIELEESGTILGSHLLVYIACSTMQTIHSCCLPSAPRSRVLLQDRLIFDCMHWATTYPCTS